MKRTLFGALFILFISPRSFAAEISTETHLGEMLPLWSVVPFIGILLSIALFPLFVPKFWHRHFGKVSAFWSLVLGIPFVLYYGSPALHEIIRVVFVDYVPFLILIGSLFVVSGGILFEGNFRGTPAANSVLLMIGTVIASWTGTTGASMLLIRPVIRSNQNRKNKAHIIVFFIFLIGNIGGSLTPLGDPPLFLGFLHGVPFFWTLHNLWITIFTAGLVLAVFFGMDTILHRRENNSAPPINSVPQKLRLELKGLHNLFYLGGIVAAVLLSGLWHWKPVRFIGVEIPLQNVFRDFVLVSLSVLSLITTKKSIREKNQFQWGPIREVAILFAGIFITIIPALSMLHAGTRGNLAFIIRTVSEPWHYFWITGALSSFLDNAPTYLTFMGTALGNFYAGLPEPQAVSRLIAEHGIVLKAVSCGAVFMGANTYIGNAPNFMVRSIAEDLGVKMPSFFGYMAYSILILIPIFILTTLLFF